ncbi:MAG: hypothetical protein CL920_06840 [Deltaproteobacteria bacterium]|nr:hypothetical protein [Deltaproteobacteria bacterium]MBU48398.1 hypothetical protein [Deltaproteobacteria bacterium]|tara:strand:+ start:13243 stop:13791 length:549 start_codon:yes stop_codon:yes gene_type:complete
MSSETQSLTIKVDEWPLREDIAEFLNTSNAKEDISRLLTEEFDTIVYFQIDEDDLLWGYPEAFILPLHAFVSSLSRGLKILSADQAADVPIFLQQNAVGPEDAAHRLHMKIDGQLLRLSLQWGGEKAPPAHLKEGNEWSLDLVQSQQVIVEFINDYCRRVTMLLGSLPDWSGEDISALFESF